MSDAATPAGGLTVEDTPQRLAALESAVADIKAQLASIASVITSVLPHLATKADVNELKAELKAEIGDLRAEVHAREASLLKWLIGTVIASMALACTIARLVA
jgi:uncharacterized small protein (DUF1192 family)